MHTSSNKVIIIGAGPAGLSAAYELQKHKANVDCIEATKNIGGMCRTIEYKGYRFDIGGHGFFSNNKEIFELWYDLLEGDFIKYSSRTMLYYRHHYFNFPPGIVEVLNKIGVIECYKIIFSLLKYHFIPIKNASTLEDVMKNNFGDYFYQRFIKKFMAKVWGTPCHLLAPEASMTVHSIKPLIIIKNKFMKTNKTVSGGRYPRYGAGQMYDALYDRVKKNGVNFQQNCKAIKLICCHNHIKNVIIETPTGDQRIPSSHVLSSIPLKDLIEMIDPELPNSVLVAASQLSYRSLIIVNLILESNIHIPFTCVNIQDPNIRMSRIHCFKNWSMKMVPDESKCSLECEYFVAEEEELWRTPDDDLIDMAKEELQRVRLLSMKDIIEGFVIRIPKAYPLLTIDHARLLKIINAELDVIDNLQSIGRGGMHSYNTMDEAMLTGILASRNILLVSKLEKNI